MQKHLEDSTAGSIGQQTAEGHATQDEIELRGCQTYLAHGGAPGQDVEDWLRAEFELREEYGRVGRTAKAAAA